MLITSFEKSRRALNECVALLGDVGGSKYTLCLHELQTEDILSDYFPSSNANEGIVSDIKKIRNGLRISEFDFELSYAACIYYLMEDSSAHGLGFMREYRHMGKNFVFAFGSVGNIPYMINAHVDFAYTRGDGGYPTQDAHIVFDWYVNETRIELALVLRAIALYNVYDFVLTPPVWEDIFHKRMLKTIQA